MEMKQIKILRPEMLGYDERLDVYTEEVLQPFPMSPDTPEEPPLDYVPMSVRKEYPIRIIRENSYSGKGQYEEISRIVIADKTINNYIDQLEIRVEELHSKRIEVLSLKRDFVKYKETMQKHICRTSLFDRIFRWNRVVKAVEWLEG